MAVGWTNQANLQQQLQQDKLNNIQMQQNNDYFAQTDGQGQTFQNQLVQQYQGQTGQEPPPVGFIEQKEQIEGDMTSIKGMMEVLKQDTSNVKLGANDSNWLKDNLENEEAILQFLDDPNN